MRYIQSINEYLSNKNEAEYLLKKLIRRIQSKVKHKIKVGQFDKKETKRGYYITLRRINEVDEKIVIKILNSFQKNFLDKGLILSYVNKDSYSAIFDDDLDIIGSEKDGINFHIYLKDLHTERVAIPKYLYHISPSKNRSEILKNGLIPKKWDEGNWTMEHKLYYPPSIFVVTNYKDWDFKFEEKSDVWEINTTNLNVRWQKDLNLFKIYGNDDKNYLMTFDKIPSEHIKLLE